VEERAVSDDLVVRDNDLVPVKQAGVGPLIDRAVWDEVQVRCSVLRLLVGAKTGIAGDSIAGMRGMIAPATKQPVEALRLRYMLSKLRVLSNAAAIQCSSLSVQSSVFCSASSRLCQRRHAIGSDQCPASSWHELSLEGRCRGEALNKATDSHGQS